MGKKSIPLNNTNVAIQQATELWKHVSWQTTFTLWVDGFSMQYASRTDAMQLIKTLQKWYKITVNWTGITYCDLALHWHYCTTKATWYVDISIPGYIKKYLHKFKHPPKKYPQNSLHPASPPLFGHKLQELPPADVSPKLVKAGKNNLQQIVGSILVYAWAANNMVLKAFNTITWHNANATKLTKQWAHQLLDYLTTHPTATVCSWVRDKVLKVHSNASYLNESHAQSSYARYFICGDHQHDHKPLTLNGAILINAPIVKFVAVSAAKAELRALFYINQSV